MEDVALERIAEEVGTPTYVYSAGHIERRFRALADSVGSRPTLLCYAVKANSSQAIIRHLHRLGAGADIVSGGELQRAMQAGVPPRHIVFSGVGKNDAEIDAAIMAGVKSINAESEGEIDRIAGRARALGRTASIALRINPDVDPVTHPYLATGLKESKFGIPMAKAFELACKAHESEGLALVGLACHIGSQIVDVSPFLDSYERVKSVIDALAGRGVRLKHLDLGGGLGIAYRSEDRQLDVKTWGNALADATRSLELELVLEPGRYLVGNAGLLMTRVLGRKHGESRGFVVVDAAMNDLLRPSLYGAYHAVVPAVLPPDDAPVEQVDIVGPICESGDFLAKDRTFSGGEPGELLAVLSAGAYGMTMASTYNTRPPAAEVLVSGDRYGVIRPRKTVEQLLADECYPEWMAS